VGATMPNAGTRNAEEHVRRLFPLASWYRASQVHKNKAELKNYFVKVDEVSRGAALRQALRHGPPGRVLVFANTLQTAEEAFEEAVAELGRDAVAFFHKDVPVYQRSLLLERFGERGGGALAATPTADGDVDGQSGEEHGQGGGAGGEAGSGQAEEGTLRVLVCTGLASRGIDFVKVSHVLQYDVASNAVEFMHRVGRTARAGQRGVSTTLYSDDRTDLVEGIRDALTTGEPIEHLFSRKRSFKLGIKKRRRRAEEGR